MNMTSIIHAAKRNKLNYVMRTTVNKEEYDGFKAACEDDALTASEVVRQFMKAYVEEAETRRALREAAAGINLSPAYDDMEELKRALEA